jgi:hypothetical protein
MRVKPEIFQGASGICRRLRAVQAQKFRFRHCRKPEKIGGYSGNAQTSQTGVEQRWKGPLPST